MINRAFIIGNLTDTPKLQIVGQYQTAMATFSIGVNEQTKKGENVYFIECKAWGKVAENAGKYLTKGKPVFLEGAVVQERWETDGQKRSRTLLRVDKIHFIDSNRSAQDINSAYNEINSQEDIW